MLLKTKKELAMFANTTGGGTKENPKVNVLPWNYKIPLYLGYEIKWDYDYKKHYDYSQIPYKETMTYDISPIFKKSYDTFACQTYYWDWDFLMETLLPKMVEDKLITDSIRKKILKFDRTGVIIESYKIIDQHLSYVIYPFVNIVNRIEKFEEEKQKNYI